MPRKTREIAELLGTHQFNLLSLIVAGKISPPAKDVSGHYSWTATDIQRARMAMQTDRRRREHRTAGREGGE